MGREPAVSRMWVPGGTGWPGPCPGLNGRVPGVPRPCGPQPTHPGPEYQLTSAGCQNMQPFMGVLQYQPNEASKSQSPQW